MTSAIESEIYVISVFALQSEWPEGVILDNRAIHRFSNGLCGFGIQLRLVQPCKDLGSDDLVILTVGLKAGFGVGNRVWKSIVNTYARTKISYFSY